MAGHSIFVLTQGTGSVFAGGFDGTVSQREVVGGQVRWHRISPVLRTDPVLGPVPIYSLAVSPLGGQSLLVGSMGAIFRGTPTTGGAWHWTRAWAWQAPIAPSSGGAPGCFGQCSGSGGGSGSAGGGAVTSLLAAPWDRRLILASLFETTPPVLISHDGGQHWEPDAGTLPATLPAQDLAVGDARARQVFLTTMGGGVWRSEGGGPWHDVSAGLPQHHAMPLVAANPASAGVLFAGTMASGVYEKVRSDPWRPLGTGLSGGAATVLGLVETPGAHPVLLAATGGGVYKYVPGR